MTELKEFTVDDLKAITWDYSWQSDIIGKFEGMEVLGFLFEVLECGLVNPEAVVRCNVAEGWVEHVDSITPFGNMRQIFENAVRDEDGNTKFVKASCRVVIKLLTAQGNFITVLKGKDNVGDVAESLGT